MNQTTTIHFTGTHEQVAQMERQCALSESMFASTLVRAIGGKTPEEQYALICDWFRTVRSMAQANLITSGIQVGLTEAITVNATLARLMRFLREKYKIEVNTIQMAALRAMLTELPLPQIDRIALLDRIAAVIKDSTGIAPNGACMANIGLVITEAMSGTAYTTAPEGHAE